MHFCPTYDYSARYMLPMVQIIRGMAQVLSGPYGLVASCIGLRAAAGQEHGLRLGVPGWLSPGSRLALGGIRCS